MTLYRLADDPPTLVDPVMIACFDGWVDAAEAASGAVAHVAADAEPMVTFDPDAIFDQRSRRPVLDVQDGRLSDLRWPACGTGLAGAARPSRARGRPRPAELLRRRARPALAGACPPRRHGGRIA